MGVRKREAVLVLWLFKEILMVLLCLCCCFIGVVVAPHFYSCIAYDVQACLCYRINFYACSLILHFKGTLCMIEFSILKSKVIVL